MNDADLVVLEEFNKLRNGIVLRGLWLVSLEIITTLLAWCRFCPVTGFCRKTALCREQLLPEWLPPFYVILCGIALPIIIWKFGSFVLSFALEQAVGPNGKLLRPKWLIKIFTLSSVTTIIFLFAALHRWTGISSDSTITHELGYCIYFSVITITTVGYGDFHPAVNSPLSHAIAALEALSGYVILGILVSSFSSMFREVGR